VGHDRCDPAGAEVVREISGLSAAVLLPPWDG
jgi:hypothetical protein